MDVLSQQQLDLLNEANRAFSHPSYSPAAVLEAMDGLFNTGTSVITEGANFLGMCVTDENRPLEERIQIAEGLLAKGAPLYPFRLLQAIERNEPEMVRVLARSGKIDLVQNNYLFTAFEKFTGLDEKEKKPVAIRELLEAGTPAAVTDEVKRNILHKAARASNGWNETGMVELMEVAIRKGGADPNAKDVIDNVPLYYAAPKSSRLTKTLLDGGAVLFERDEQGNETPIHNKEGDSPLHSVFKNSTPIADRLDTLASAKLILSRSGDSAKRQRLLDHRNAEGETALLQASNNAMTDGIEGALMLLESAANPNIPDYERNSPLHGAAWVAARLAGESPPNEDGKKLIQSLLDHGADPRIPNKKGQTPRQSLEREFREIEQRAEKWRQENPEFSTLTDAEWAAGKQKREGQVQKVLLLLQEKENALSAPVLGQQSAMDPMQKALEQYRSGVTLAAPAAEPELMTLKASAVPVQAKQGPHASRS